MSFDTKHADYDKGSESVLIPFEQGDVFRRVTLWLIQQIFKVLIPFEQGDVFRPWW